MIIDEHIFGLAAGALTTICNIPQAVKVLRTRNTKPISLTSYFLSLLCLLLWLVYGLGINDTAIIATNLAILPLILIVLLRKIYNLRKGID